MLSVVIIDFPCSCSYSFSCEFTPCVAGEQVVGAKNQGYVQALNRLTRVGFWGVRGGTRPHPSPLHRRWRGSRRVQGTERPHHSPTPLPPLLSEKNLPL